MTTESLTRLARAKINLTLHVTGQRADGYHLLDSLVCFANVGDQLEFAPAEQISVQVDGPFAAAVPLGDDNLVLRAAHLLRDQTRTRASGAAITLTKNLPAAAGIGGGSADAAATLLGLAEMWDVPLPEHPEQLGADVPVCLSPVALRMRGTGEQLSLAPVLPPLWAVLVNPGVPVETPPVFKALEKKDNPPMGDLPLWEDASSFTAWCAEQRNDLQAPARHVTPVISDVLTALEGSLLARMSGSGATCFGLCDSAQSAIALAAQIASDHPEWWVVHASLS